MILTQRVFLGDPQLMGEWENNGNVAIKDPENICSLVLWWLLVSAGPYELGDEVEVEGEVDHGEDERALDAGVLGRHQPLQKTNISINPVQGPASAYLASATAEKPTCEEEAKCEKAEKVGQEHIGLVDVPATFLFVYPLFGSCTRLPRLNTKKSKCLVESSLAEA